MSKKFKDPLYGYVEIDDNIVFEVIDTAVFQRLRDIVQTSYAPLYSSALHNRFVHSIGVYYLGKIAAEAFRLSVCNEKYHFDQDINKYIEIFELACLLHDVGHAPFSHTGEKFYLYKGKRDKLHQQIIELTDDAELEREIIDASYKAAPHELMSVIISLREYSDLIPTDMRSFFARCITGYKYINNMNRVKSCKNCLIELLNSEIIDVDKIDYLIRDSYVTGFNTVSIDYKRLLQSIQLFSADGKENYKLCFGKSAVSVLENVVYAHDAERKWIQNHPIVLYEAYIIENAMQKIMDDILKSDSLSDRLLSVEGDKIDCLGRIRLLGDSDIIYLMKNLQDDIFAKEYYDRKLRKHPMWKTEAEFQAIFQGEESRLIIIEEEFMELKKHLNSMGFSFIINKRALAASQKELVEKQKILEELSEKEQQERQLAAVEANKIHIKWMQIFESFAEANKDKLDFEFLIIFANQFNSGFRKQEFSNIKIVFPELKQPCVFKDVSSILTSKESKRENFFFIYYNRKTDKDSISFAKLINSMINLSTEIMNNNKLK